MNFILQSGAHDRKHTPVFFRMPADELLAFTAGGAFCLKPGNGQCFPAIYKTEGWEAEVCFVVPFLPAGEALPLTLKACDCEPVMTCEKTSRGAELDRKVVLP